MQLLCMYYGYMHRTDWFLDYRANERLDWGEG